MDELENSQYGGLDGLLPEAPSIVPITESTFAGQFDVLYNQTTPQEWVVDRSREQLCGNSISDATWNAILDKEIIQVFQIVDKMGWLHALAVAHRDDVRPQSSFGATRLMFVCSPPNAREGIWLLALLAVLEFASTLNEGRVVLRLPRGDTQAVLAQELGQIFGFVSFPNESDQEGVWYEVVSSEEQVTRWSGILQQRLGIVQIPDPQGDALPGDLELDYQPDANPPLADFFGNSPDRARQRRSPVGSPPPSNGRRRLPRHAPEGKFWCGRHKRPEEPEAMDHDAWRILDDLSIVRDPTRQIGRPLRQNGTPYQCWKSGLHSGGGKTRQRPPARR